MLEIPRTVSSSVSKLLFGCFLALIALAVVTSPSTARDPAIGYVLGGIVALPALLMIASNVRLLIQRPVALRATDAGVWFGGGPLIPWGEVASIYESTAPVQLMFLTATADGIVIAFRRKRTVLRLPLAWWLTSYRLGVVRISTTRVQRPPAAIAAQLEQLRFAACGHEDGALPGATEPPAARLLRR